MIHKMQDAEYKIVPRIGYRKQEIFGKEVGIATKEIVLNASLLRKYFASPLHTSAKAIGICATVLKK